jgi:glycolate oxidase FAD binding subunit
MRLTPDSEAGLADAVRAAHAAREPLAIEGNGTKRAWLRPVQAARTLSTAALAGITLYRPKELILSARAGTPLPEIEAVLAAQGQHLISEPYDLSALMQAARPPPCPSPASGRGDGAALSADGPLSREAGEGQGGGRAALPTLGGIVATNLSGPRRIAWGATRDHVLGVRAVNGMGEVFTSGGRVLKNVTGLDLCKLLTGSFGTLAVLSEITLKVLPAPQAVGSVLVETDDAVAGVATLSRGLGAPYGVSAAAYLPRAAALAVGLPRGAALLRLEDFSASVAYRGGRLATELGGTLLDEAASRAVWKAVRALAPLDAAPQDAVWKISVRPSAGPGVAAALEQAGARRWFADWGGGLLWASGPATGAMHAAVTRAANQSGGVWQIVRAPDGLSAAVDAVSPDPAPLAAIAARVKAVLDPHGIFNPGRMRAGL